MLWEICYIATLSLVCGYALFRLLRFVMPSDVRQPVQESAPQPTTYRRAA